MIWKSRSHPFHDRSIILPSIYLVVILMCQFIMHFSQLPITLMYNILTNYSGTIIKLPVFGLYNKDDKILDINIHYLST